VIFDIESRGGGYILGEQATGLLVDLQAIYCAGAYISSVVIACTIVDAHLRETELHEGFEGGVRAAFLASQHNAELEWLRKRRNELVHLKRAESPAISVDDQWIKRGKHADEAKRAILVTAAVLFENPWV
jgi:hypothetical protein